ncbi:hypothetical protein ACFSTC_19255 [Nonomuraea ferruginea]
MTIALGIVIALFYLQALAKFGLWLLVPYDVRIKRIAAYYARSQRLIGIYDTLTLLCVVAIIALQFAAGLSALSFAAGLVARHEPHPDLHPPLQRAPGREPAPARAERRPTSPCRTPSRPGPPSAGARSSSWQGCRCGRCTSSSPRSWPVEGRVSTPR